MPDEHGLFRIPADPSKPVQQLCEGSADEYDAPICDGPNIKPYRVRPSEDEPEFIAWYCDDCRDQAINLGYILEPVQDGAL